MFKAKLFNYKDSGIYYRKFGISPDKHYDKLCERYGKETALRMIDENMMKAWEGRQKELEERDELEKRILDAECPF